MKELTKRCYIKLTNQEEMQDLMPEIAKFVEEKCYVLSIPFMFTYGFDKSNMYTDLKSDSILKKVFVEACMKSDLPSSILYDYAKSMFGDNDLLFYLYILGTDFKHTSIYKTYFRNEYSPQCKLMFVLKLIISILLIIVLVMVIVFVIHRFKLIDKIRNKFE